MGTPIKITQEELDSFNKAKDAVQKIVIGFGQLYLERMELDHINSELMSKEKHLREEVLKIRKEELDLMDKMLEKYGEGSLSLDTGTFISNK